MATAKLVICRVNAKEPRPTIGHINYSNLPPRALRSSSPQSVGVAMISKRHNTSTGVTIGATPASESRSRWRRPHLSIATINLQNNGACESGPATQPTLPRVL
jgi:hypothetical protein